MSRYLLVEPNSSFSRLVSSHGPLPAKDRARELNHELKVDVRMTEPDTDRSDRDRSDRWESGTCTYLEITQKLAN